MLIQFRLTLVGLVVHTSSAFVSLDTRRPIVRRRIQTHTRASWAKAPAHLGVRPSPTTLTMVLPGSGGGSPFLSIGPVISVLSILWLITHPLVRRLRFKAGD